MEEKKDMESLVNGIVKLHEDAEKYTKIAMKRDDIINGIGELKTMCNKISMQCDTLLLAVDNHANPITNKAPLIPEIGAKYAHPKRRIIGNQIEVRKEMLRVLNDVRARLASGQEISYETLYNDYQELAAYQIGAYIAKWRNVRYTNYPRIYTMMNKNP